MVQLCRQRVVGVICRFLVLIPSDAWEVALPANLYLVYLIMLMTDSRLMRRMRLNRRSYDKFLVSVQWEETLSM